MAYPLMAFGIKEYSQPDFYHFNEDSVELAVFIRKELKLTKNHLLCEFGAGCGVISIEIARCSNFQSIQMVEAQEDFLPHLKNNINRYNLKGVEYIIADVNSLQERNKYDCIYFNPPYFYHENSRAGVDLRRDRCRRIKKDELLGWIKIAKILLKLEGHLFFSFRERLNVPFKLINEEQTKGCFLFHYQNY